MAIHVTQSIHKVSIDVTHYVPFKANTSYISMSLANVTQAHHSWLHSDQYTVYNIMYTVPSTLLVMMDKLIDHWEVTRKQVHL